MNHVFRSVLLASCAIAPAAILPVTSAYAQTANRNYSIAPQGMDGALRQFASQSGQDVVFEPSLVAGLKSKGLQGSYDAETALRAIIRGSKLEAYKTSSGFALRGNESAAVTDSDGKRQSSSGEDAGKDAQAGISEILVVGSRSQNVDIRRTEDDPQPYVVFDAEEIQNSNATNVEDFLRTRLPMNTQNVRSDQRSSLTGSFDQTNAGLINLRGLGSRQTLVLVDGRRIAGVGAFDIQQGNISGIPISSIERIEVLPSTAGAIYGGDAVGGVVNVVLKRNFNGLDATIDYGNTFDGSTGDLRLSLNGGFHSGGTQVSFSLSRNNTGDLSFSERSDLLKRSRNLLLSNNPSSVGGQFFMPLGTTPNIQSVAAFDLDYFLQTGLVRYIQPDLSLKSNGQTLGSTFTHVPVGYGGPFGAPIMDGGAALAQNAGTWNLSVPKQPSVLLRGVKSIAVGANVRQKVGAHVEAFLDFNWNRTPSEYKENYLINGTILASDPRNPFNEDVNVNYILPGVYSTYSNLVKNSQINGGLIVRLPKKWSMTIEHDFGRSDTNSESVTRPLSDNDLNDALGVGFSDPSLTNPGPYNLRTQPTGSFGPSSVTSHDTALRIAGPIFNLSGGAANLSGLVERRSQRTGYLTQFVDSGFSPPFYAILPPQDQDVTTFYSEVRLPLTSGGTKPLLRELEIQASIRHDKYASKGVDSSTFFFGPTEDDAKAAAKAATYSKNKFSSTDYLLAFRYSPVESLAFRGSYSTGFLPPSLSQITPNRSVQNVSFGTFYIDPKRGNTPLTGDANGDVLFIQGGNSNLDPERSRSISIGAIIEPSAIPGFRLSVDYTSIRKVDEILSAGAQFTIDNEDQFPGRVIRAPSGVSGVPGPIIQIDSSAYNVGHSRAKAIDYQVEYTTKRADLGEVHAYAVFTQSLDLRRQLVPGGVYTKYSGFIDGPLKFRGNLGFDWKKGPWTAGWNAQYYSHYVGYPSGSDNGFIASQGTARIPSQWYNDLYAGFDLGRVLRTADAELAIGVQNIFDKRPPTINANYGIYSTYGDPRLRRFTVSLRTHF